jgi:hypothetical protein
MRTDSMSVPSNAFQRVLRVIPSSQAWSRTAVSSGGMSSPTSRSRTAAGRSVMSAGSSASLPK